ncbi:unnamed protein product [Blepharisma stoltei]|uniref:Uncharacterized protein n=1 Tax=Blepharisma stoltei TaxID=1481888 RepID=A0AAU9KE08_9CILI|nr:unnamed protein product [Blepharisma stoltei]
MKSSKTNYSQKQIQKHSAEDLKPSQSWVMSRLDWFLYVEEIFNSAKSNPKSLKVNAFQVVKSLEKISSKLPLVSPSKYRATKQLIAYSYNEVVKKILEFNQEFDCDELLDALIDIKDNYSHKDENASTLNISGLQDAGKFDVTRLLISQNDTAKRCVKPSSSNSLSITNISQGFSMPQLPVQILYLNLSSNNISETEWNIPQSLILLNLSNNLLTEFSNSLPLVNLQYLNFNENQLSYIDGIAGFKALLEIYIKKNSIANIGSLCKISNLKIIDAEDNMIEKYEDVAPLALSTKLQTLNLKGNKITEAPNYKEFIPHLLPKLRYIDPPEIFSLSQCQLSDFLFPTSYNIGFHHKKHQSLPSTPIHICPINIHETPIPSKPPQKYFSELSETHKIDLSQISCSAILNSSKISTPKTCTRPGSPVSTDKKKISRSTNASPRPGKVGLNKQFRTPGKSNKLLRSSLVSTARINEADESYLNFSNASKVSVINSETITNSMKIGYGNPVAAMMIKPATHARNRVKSMG